MRIAVVGLGGVGGYVGAKLCQVKGAHEIIFIARGEHLKAIQTRGLTLVHEGKREVAHPSLATDDPSSLGIFDLVIFCTKSYDLKDAAQKLRANITSQTVVIPLGNGVEHDRELKELFPNAIVLNGCIYILSHLSAPGEITMRGKGALMVYGPRSADPVRLGEIDALLASCGITTRLVEDITTEVWKKYLFISAFAALTSYYEEPIGAVVRHHKNELLGLLGEILLVAQRSGAKLQDEAIQKAVELAEKSPYESKTSMQLDFEKRGKTELETLLGFVVQKALSLNLETPLAQTLYDALLKKSTSEPNTLQS